LLELLVVTAGVLIALSVDTLREWRSERSLAAEARTTMLAEIAENRQALEDNLPALRATQQVYLGVLRDARARRAGQPVDASGDVNMNFTMVPLSTAAYATAEITGAVGFMTFNDVRRFAAVYEAQRRFQEMQDRFARDVYAVVAPAMFGGDLSGARPQDLDTWVRGLEQLLAGLQMLAEFGEGLRQGYAVALDAK
jgi:hypothetical protein